MSNDLTSQTLLNSLPYALSVDSNMYALASSIADELKRLYDDNEQLTIYPKINQLSEQLLDILAYDFKVDWYLADGTVESKRAQIQSCIYVHRHLGTKGAVAAAISDMCTNSEIEEWYEYNGSPYYYRIVLDVTRQRMEISQTIVERLVAWVQPVRALLETNGIVYRIRRVIQTSALLTTGITNYVPCGTILCGTYPIITTLGQTIDKQVKVELVTVSYSTDYLFCGTYPEITTKGYIGTGAVEMTVVSTVINNTYYLSGTRQCGIYY